MLRKDPNDTQMDFQIPASSETKERQNFPGRILGFFGLNFINIKQQTLGENAIGNFSDPGASLVR